MASNLEFQGHSGGRSVTFGLQGHSSDPSTSSMLQRRSGECLPAALLEKTLRHTEHSSGLPATCPRMQKKKRQFTRWSQKNTRTVVKYFEDFISGEGLPGKADIVAFKQKYPTVEYEWMTIRTKVLNEQKAYAKRKQIAFDSVEYL